MISIVSHSRITPPKQHEDDVGPSNAKVPSDDVSPPLHGAGDAQRLQMIAVIMDNPVDLVSSGGKVYTLTSQPSHLTRMRGYLDLIIILYYLHITCGITQTLTQ